MIIFPICLCFICRLFKADKKQIGIFKTFGQIVLNNGADSILFQKFHADVRFVSTIREEKAAELIRQELENLYMSSN